MLDQTAFSWPYYVNPALEQRPFYRGLSSPKKRILFFTITTSHNSNKGRAVFFRNFIKHTRIKMMISYKWIMKGHSMYSFNKLLLKGKSNPDFYKALTLKSMKTWHIFSIRSKNNPRFDFYPLKTKKRNYILSLISDWANISPYLSYPRTRN